MRFRGGGDFAQRRIEVVMLDRMPRRQNDISPWLKRIRLQAVRSRPGAGVLLGGRFTITTSARAVTARA